MKRLIPKILVVGLCIFLLGSFPSIPSIYFPGDEIITTSYCVIKPLHDYRGRRISSRERVIVRPRVPGIVTKTSGFSKVNVIFLGVETTTMEISTVCIRLFERERENRENEKEIRSKGNKKDS
jgi:hypothetical protein